MKFNKQSVGNAYNGCEYLKLAHKNRESNKPMYRAYFKRAFFLLYPVMPCLIEEAGEVISKRPELSNGRFGLKHIAEEMEDL